MNTRHAVIGGVALLAAVSGPAMAQTGTGPSTTTPPSTGANPSTGTGPSSGMDQMTGRHSMAGTITSLDEKNGWIHLKTEEGTLIMPVPPAALQGVKKGDTVTVNLALKDNGQNSRKR